MLRQVGWAKKRAEDFIDMIYNHLIIENTESGIKIVKISRPSALNALNTQVLLELRHLLISEAENNSTRVLILTGDGEKAFIAGADINEMIGKSASEGVEFSQAGHEVTKLLELIPKPTIAAVNGYALGGGTEIALACDFIVASEKAVFGLPEVSLGLIPGFGGTIRLAKSVGLPRARELIYSGRKIKADEALSMGMVNHVYPSSQFMADVLALAKLISSQSFPAIAQAKRLMNEFSETSGLNSKLDAEAQTFSRLFGSHDQIEGLSAFAEKRKPKFMGL
jgi:enoyl-CoA hydratase